MNNINYDLQMQQTLTRLSEEGRVPSLLLHVCCAPCSSTCLERLTDHFRMTLYYDNPNITDRAEYEKRADEVMRLAHVMPHHHPVDVIIVPYEQDVFFDRIHGYEEAREGGARCSICYQLRLHRAAVYAAANHYDYFTTSLSLSPRKDAKRINRIGAKEAKQNNVAFLYADFKKRDGYLRSIQLSDQYDLYRQDYCGCIFSKRSKS